MLDGADITRLADEPAGAAASRAGAGGPPHRDEPHGAREPADGRVCAQDMRAVDAEIADIYRAFPNLAARRDALRVGALGRRAADAGDRPRAVAAPQVHDARRAIAGLEPAADQRGVRADCRASTARAALRSCWSSRIRTRRWSSPTALTCWSLAARSWKALPAGSARRSVACATPIWGARRRANKLQRVNLSNRREEKVNEIETFGIAGRDGVVRGGCR